MPVYFIYISKKNENYLIYNYNYNTYYNETNNISNNRMGTIS